MRMETGKREILPSPAASSAGREYSVPCLPLASLKVLRVLNRLCNAVLGDMAGSGCARRNEGAIIRCCVAVVLPGWCFGDYLHIKGVWVSAWPPDGRESRQPFQPRGKAAIREPLPSGSRA